MSLERNPEWLVRALVRVLGEDAQERIGVVAGEAELVPRGVKEFEADTGEA
jgi:hypothetical protein